MNPSIFRGPVRAKSTDRAGDLMKELRKLNEMRESPGVDQRAVEIRIGQINEEAHRLSVRAAHAQPMMLVPGSAKDRG